MPSLETVVRPVVLPDIRPLPTQNLTSEPDEAQTEISSSGGGPIDLAHSETISWNKSEANERSENVPTATAPKPLGRYVDILRVFRIKTPSEAGDPSTDPSLPLDPTVPRDERYVDRTQYIDQEITTVMHLTNEHGELITWRFKKPTVEFNMELILENVFKPG